MAFTAGQRVRYRTTSSGDIWRHDWAGRTATVREDSGARSTNIKWDAGLGVDSYNEDTIVLTCNLELIPEETPADQPLTAGDRVRYKTQRTVGAYWDSSMSGELGTCIGMSNHGAVRVDWDNRGQLVHYPQNIEKIPARTEHQIGDIVRVAHDEDGIPSRLGDLFQVTELNSYPGYNRGTSVSTGDAGWNFSNTRPIVTPVTQDLSDVWADGNVIQFTVRGRILGDELHVGCKRIRLDTLNQYLINLEPRPDGYQKVTLQGTVKEVPTDCTCSECADGAELRITWNSGPSYGNMTEGELGSYGRDYKLISTNQPF